MRSRALQALGDVVATISQEIRNPLGIIKSTAQRRSKKYNTIDDEIFEFISDEGNLLNEIPSGYPEFASLEP